MVRISPPIEKSIPNSEKTERTQSSAQICRKAVLVVGQLILTICKDLNVCY
jgi:hypothetical protein